MSPQSGPPCLLKPVCVPFGNRRCPEKTCGGAAGGRAVGIGTIFSRMPRERRPWWACRGCDSRTAGRERTRTEGPSVCIYLWYVSLHFLQRKGSFSVPFTGPRINCTFLKPLGSRSPTVPFPGESGVCVRAALPGKAPGLPPLTAHAACSPALQRQPPLQARAFCTPARPGLQGARLGMLLGVARTTRHPGHLPTASGFSSPFSCAPLSPCRATDDNVGVASKCPTLQPDQTS